MSSSQKVIKYCAIAFAIILAVGIISGIANAAFAIISTVSGGRIFHNNSKTVDFTETFDEVKSLDIDTSTGQLKIKIGDTFKVEADNVSEDFEAKVTGSGKLVISDKNDNFNFLWFNFDGFNGPNARITLYLPEGFIAEETKINSGAGSVSVEDLNTGYLFISAGAGSINGSNISAEEVKIDGGVGAVKLSDVNFTDTDLDCGVGSLKIDGVLLGNNKIDCGVGEVDLDLIGDVEDYELDIDSGLGTIRINGEKIKDSHRSNNDAEHKIKVDGGVGSVKINIYE